MTDADARPSFIAWVCGDETRSDEYDQLVALVAPGLRIGAWIDELDYWGNIEPEEHPDSIEFVRAALEEIHRLIESDDLGASTEASTVLLPCGAVQEHTRQDGRATIGPETPSSRARSGTRWDRTNKGSSGS